VVPPELVAQLLGLDPKTSATKDTELARELIRALAVIVPELSLTPGQHPLQSHIEAGVKAYPRLQELLAQAPNGHEQALVLDAIAHVIERDPHNVPVEVLRAVTHAMSASTDSTVVTAAARALAVAQEEGFLAQQRAFLASPDPVEVRKSARLCGWARDKAALEPLLLALRPDNIVCADMIVWALGELGNERAVPKLHGMLLGFAEVEPVCVALGKIGSPRSIEILLPFVREGTGSQREAATSALCAIARKHGAAVALPEHAATLNGVLYKAMDDDENPRVRFWAALALAELGVEVSEQRMLKALGAKASSSDVSKIGQFFANRRAVKKH
jgi:hypothetical protein